MTIYEHLKTMSLGDMADAIIIYAMFLRLAGFITDDIDSEKAGKGAEFITRHLQAEYLGDLISGGGDKP